LVWERLLFQERLSTKTKAIHSSWNLNQYSYVLGFVVFPETPLTDLEIIKSVLAGNSDAFAELVQRYQHPIVLLCQKLIPDAALAEDAAQDSFVRAFKELSSFKGQSSFPTWLHRIAVNRCLDLLRKRKRERTDPIDSELENIPTDEPVSDDRRWALQVLSAIDDKEKSLLILREVQGLSYLEMAAVLGCSIDAVKARLKRARKSLQEKARHFSRLENV
jgi:RNA polymerase sigma-70 factor (ECF subfamily)